MKTMLAKTLKVISYSVVGLFLTFVVYANLTPAPMHARVKPISMTILKVEGLDNNFQADRVRNSISKAPGVTACSANSTSSIVSITFDPDQTSATALSQLVGNLTHQAVKNASFEGIEPSGPQCPVPLSYIMAFERVKYAFCFR